MPFRYSLRNLKEIDPKPPVTSVLSHKIAPEHDRFFSSWNSSMAKDTRPEIPYRFGPSVKEPGIAERWQGYETHYRSHRRLNKFSFTIVKDAIVEPTSLTVLGRDYVLRETVRSLKTFSNMFGDISADEARRLYQVPGSTLETARDFAPKDSVDEAFLLGFGVFDNYFNWTLRFVSRLRQFTALPSSVKLLVPKSKRSYVQKTLRFFDIPAERVVEVAAPLRIGRLWLFSPIAVGRYELSPEMIVNLREHPRVQSLADTGVRKLYVPRTNVAMRHVVNEALLCQRLIALGFQVFDNSEHSLEEQAQAFRSAELIVSPHGAGLTNIVYSRPKTKVVEIIPEGYDQGVTSYRSLADLFGHTYIPLFAREAAVDRKGNRCNSNIEIDIGEVIDVVQKLS